MLLRPSARSWLNSLAGASRWLRDKRGNVSITYAFALVPIIALLGLGTDWYQQESFKKRFDAAADSAALAAVTTAKAYVVANPNDANALADAVAAGTAQAKKTFQVNSGTAASHFAFQPTINFPLPQNQTYTATVSYGMSSQCQQPSCQVMMPTTFSSIYRLLGVTGATGFQLSGSATSTLTMGQYIDFYVLVDVSGSMGIPTTTAGQSSLAAINPDDRSSYPTGCVFACHFPGNQGYTLAEQKGISLRVDTVGQALTALYTTATNQEKYSGIANQFRIGLYPYIVHAIDAAPLSSNFAQGIQVAAHLGGTYLDQGWTGNGLTPPTASNGTQIGSGGTHFEYFETDMPQYVQSVGNGQTAAAPKPFLFLITDGMDNSQTYGPAQWSGGSQPQLPATYFCQLAKSYPNFTVGVLYIPYVPITNPNSSFAGDEDDRANAVVPFIPPTLSPPSTQYPQGCATPGFFFTASSPSDINNALQTMFFQALQVARLSQ